MQMFLCGRWQDTDQTIEVCSPFDRSVVDTVPKASPADVDAVLGGLELGARRVRALAATGAYARFPSPAATKSVTGFAGWLA